MDQGKKRKSNLAETRQTDGRHRDIAEISKSASRRALTHVRDEDEQGDPVCLDLTDEGETVFLNENGIPSIDEHLAFYLNEDHSSKANKDAVNQKALEDEIPMYVNGKSLVCGGDNNRKFICSLCDKAFALKHNLEYHMIIHTGEKNFECGICKASFSLRHHLTQHMITHVDKSAAKKYTCSICNRSFLQGYNLTRHFRVHTGEKRFFCQICNKFLANSWSLQNHLMIHSDEKPFQCEICEKDFRKKFHLQKHLKTHSSENRSSRKRRSNSKVAQNQKGKLTCHSCNAIFPSQAKLKNHDCDFFVTGYLEKDIKIGRAHV